MFQATPRHANSRPARWRPALAAAALILTAVPAAGIVPAAARGAPDSFADLVENVLPAVVAISTGATSTDASDKATGSGFLIDAAGIVVTNNHVVSGADRISVILEDGRSFPATLHGVDLETDLAVLKLEGAGVRFPHVSFGDSRAMRVGDWVVAIGQPFGLGGSVSAGIVSGKGRNIDNGLYDDFLQTDAAINRGNSGGPLFGLDGRVVGVNTIIYSETGGNVGVGFAVPSALAKPIVEQLLRDGETHRGYLGVVARDLTAREAGDLPGGALVLAISGEDSPAARAGLVPGDIVTSLGRAAIRDRADLNRAVADLTPGSEVPIGILRDGRSASLRAKIVRREAVTAQGNGAIAIYGLTLEPADAHRRSLYGLPPEARGAVVAHVDQTSPLSAVLRPGDLIVEAAHLPVGDPLQVRTRLNAGGPDAGRPIPMLVRRGDRIFEAHLQP